MIKPKKCVKCGIRPEINESKTDYYIECCMGKVHSWDKNKVIEKWNKTNRIYNYICGIKYDIELETEKVSKSLDFMLEYTDDQESEAELIRMMSDNKLFGTNKEDAMKYRPDGSSLMNKMNLINTRFQYEQDIKLMCKFESHFQISRKDMENMIKYMSDEKFKNSIIKRKI